MLGQNETLATKHMAGKTQACGHRSYSSLVVSDGNKPYVFFSIIIETSDLEGEGKEEN